MRSVAIVLAAGKAQRFGGDKLNAAFRGKALIDHAIAAALAAPVERVIVVSQLPKPAAYACSMEWITIASDALSTSLKAGIAAAGNADAAFIFLGDMPLIPHHVAGELAARIGSSYAAVPRFHGRQGHPVLLSARAFAAIVHLHGDEGAGRLLRAHNDVAFVDVEDEAVLIDVDSREDLARLAGEN